MGLRPGDRSGLVVQEVDSPERSLGRETGGADFDNGQRGLL